MLNEGKTDEESRLAFISNNGVIEVKIFVSLEALEPHEHMDLRLVFTPYKSKYFVIHCHFDLSRKQCIYNTSLFSRM